MSHRINMSIYSILYTFNIKSKLDIYILRVVNLEKEAEKAFTICYATLKYHDCFCNYYVAGRDRLFRTHKKKIKKCLETNLSN